jgi:cbb3-type cytochrome oxidase subunit 3
MSQEFFASRLDLLLGPQLAFGLFFVFFLGVLAWVFFGMKNKEEVNRIASLPLEDDTQGGVQGE